jgi:hypothetical protein
VEKPKVIKEKKKPVENIIEDEEVEEQPPKELKRSSRERKQKREQAKNSLKNIDWQSVNSIAKVKDVLKNIIDKIEDMEE